MNIVSTPEFSEVKNEIDNVILQRSTGIKENNKYYSYRCFFDSIEDYIKINERFEYCKMKLEE